MSLRVSPWTGRLHLVTNDLHLDTSRVSRLSCCTKECLAESQLLPMRCHPYSQPSCDNPKHLHTLPVSRWSWTTPNWILIEPHRISVSRCKEQVNHNEIVQFISEDKKPRNTATSFQYTDMGIAQLTLEARNIPWPHSYSLRKLRKPC